MYVKGLKQTSDMAKEVRFATAPPNPKDSKGWVKSGGGLGWSKQSFNAMAWEAFDATLESKGQMYRLWLSKQSSG